MMSQLGKNKLAQQRSECSEVGPSWRPPLEEFLQEARDLTKANQAERRRLFQMEAPSRINLKYPK